MAENIDAERAAFEAWADGKYHLNRAPRSHNEYYISVSTQHAWDAWQAARRTPSASTGEDGMPDLPPPDVIAYANIGDNDAYSAAAVRQAQRDAVAADRRAREVYEVPIPGDGFFGGLKMKIDPTLPPDTIEMRGANRIRANLRTGQIWEVRARGEESPQASQGVKTWQERYNEMGKGPSLNDKSVAMMAEIDDLRAQLAAPKANLQTAVQEAWNANAELSKLRAAPPLSSEPQAGLVQVPREILERASYWDKDDAAEVRKAMSGSEQQAEKGAG